MLALKGGGRMFSVMHLEIIEPLDASGLGMVDLKRMAANLQ